MSLKTLLRLSLFCFAVCCVSVNTQTILIHDALAQTNPSAEIEHWKAIADSNDPLLYQDHLERFPNGTFSKIIEKRLAELADRAPAPSGLVVERWNGSYSIFTSFDHGGARCGLDGWGELKIHNGRVQGYWTNGKAGGGLEGTISNAGVLDATVKTGIVFVYIKGSDVTGTLQGEWETRGEVICGGKWNMTKL